MDNAEHTIPPITHSMGNVRVTYYTIRQSTDPVITQTEKELTVRVGGMTPREITVLANGVVIILGIATTVDPGKHMHWYDQGGGWDLLVTHLHRPEQV